jgi:hypothetical protein
MFKEPGTLLISTVPANLQPTLSFSLSIIAIISTVSYSSYTAIISYKGLSTYLNIWNSDESDLKIFYIFVPIMSFISTAINSHGHY